MYEPEITGAGSLDRKELLEREIVRWEHSPKRLMQIKGHMYYEGEHDILSRKRTAIGENGDLEEITNLPNNRLIDNQYAKLVNQKANYLLGQPFIFDGENKSYIELLKGVFDRKFMKTLKNAGKAALCGGISWLYPYYTKEGRLAFRMFPGYEILPFWTDSEHTELVKAVRLYKVVDYSNVSPKLVTKAEIFSKDGISCHNWDGSMLSDPESRNPYVLTRGGGVNWEKIPLIPVKYNERETSLLKRVKSIQDGINVMLSDFENNMQEDARNTILVLKNYDGENLGQFRKNLATYGAVKVRYDGDTKGGVDTLEIQLNSDNYKAILEIFKKALIENGMGYDAKDDRLSGNPNQMNIQSMYSDIDLDANDMETELQAAFDLLLWFANVHLANTGKGNFEGENVNVIFNRDILINETEAISNCAASVGILSDETIIAQHPWVDDPQREMERLKKQREEAEYQPFPATSEE